MSDPNTVRKWKPLACGCLSSGDPDPYAPRLLTVNFLCPTCPDRSRAKPVTQEIEGRVFVCDDCAANEELREHARRDWR